VRDFAQYFLELLLQDDLCRRTSLASEPVTAYAMQGDQEKILNSGFNGYLSKPVNARSLAEELERLLGKRENRDAPPNPLQDGQAAEKTRAAGRGE
jgi:DNA-binding response OmpR family regulator